MEHLESDCFAFFLRRTYSTQFLHANKSFENRLLSGDNVTAWNSNQWRRKCFWKSCFLFIKYLLFICFSFLFLPAFLSPNLCHSFFVLFICFFFNAFIFNQCFLFALFIHYGSPFNNLWPDSLFSRKFASSLITETNDKQKRSMTFLIYI